MFLQRYAQESIDFRNQVKWFTTFIGKKSTAEFLKQYLQGHIADTHRDIFNIVVIYDEIMIDGSHTKRWMLCWKFVHELKRVETIDQSK